MAETKKEKAMTTITNWIRDHLLSNETDYENAKIAFLIGAPIGLMVAQSSDGIKLIFWLSIVMVVGFLGPIGLMKKD